MSMEEPPVDAEERAVPSRQHGSSSAPQGGATFFSTPELRQRLDLLRHLTDNSEKILLLKGVEGTGKSTLLQQYRNLSRDEWMVCSLTADPMLQPDPFYTLLFRRFGLTDPAAMNIDGLLKRFEMLHAAGRLPVIVVDDAHLLPVATLIALFRLFERRPGNRALIRVVLFATPEICTLFQTPQLQAMNLQSVQSLEMPLFDQDQSQAYIRFLLDGEGRRELNLPPGRTERIIKESTGIPGLLEAQWRALFAVDAEGAGEPVVESGAIWVMNVRTILADLPVSVLVGAPLLGLLLLVTLIFQDEINSLFDQPGTEPLAEAPVPPGKGGVRPLKLPDLARNLPQRDSATAVEEQAGGVPPAALGPAAGEAPLAGQMPTQPEPVFAAPEEPAAEKEVTPAADAPAPEETGAPAVTDRGSETETAALETGTVTAGRETETAMVEAESETATAEPATLVATRPGGEGPRATEGQATPPEDAPAGEMPVMTAAQAPEPPTPSSPASETVVAGAARDEQWILTRRPEAYTLQLVGVGDETAARRFITQHRLQGDVTYFKTLRAGQPWFSVIYGVYPDRDAALRDRATLPPTLRSSDIWPRTYASIQAVIGQ